MYKKRILAMLIAILATFSLAACGIESSETGEDINRTITDSYDREVELNGTIETIVSVGPNITEAIYAIGDGDKLVGRTDYCDYPEEVVDVDSIGSLQEPNIERIVEISPDLVVASTHFPKESLDRLEEAGLDVLVLYGEESFEGVYETIETLGLALESEKEAENVISNMKNKVADVESKLEGLEKKDVYYVVSYGEGGDYTATGETFISDIIDMAGGNNIASDAEGWQYSLEKLVEKDPEIMVCSKYFDTKAGIESANGYSELTAVKEGRLFEIDNNKLDRQGPRLAEGLEDLAKIIHPDAF